MTNVEIYLESAIEKLENGQLTSWEADFVESIRDYTKKELRGLSSKQFKTLRSIANS